MNGNPEQWSMNDPKPMEDRLNAVIYLQSTLSCEHWACFWVKLRLPSSAPPEENVFLQEQLLRDVTHVAQNFPDTRAWSSLSTALCVCTCACACVWWQLSPRRGCAAQDDPRTRASLHQKHSRPTRETYLCKLLLLQTPPKPADQRGGGGDWCQLLFWLERELCLILLSV